VRALAGSRAALAAPLAPAALLLGFLWMRGCSAADAAAAALGLLALLVGLAFGGTAACYPASFFTGSAFLPLDRAGPCAVFAAWTALLWTLVLIVAKLLGMGPEAAIFTSLFVVVWGVGVGTHIVTGDDEVEPGRRLVGSCLGLTGALGGLVAALVVVQAELVMVVASPLDTGGLEAGDALIVRRDEEPPAGSLVLLREGREAALGRVSPGGVATVVGETLEKGNWTVFGRVFYTFGGVWGGRALLDAESP